MFEEPEFPDEEIQGDRIVMKVWEMEYKDYKENAKKLNEHKIKLMGNMLGQMTDASKDQVKTSLEGKEAIENKDPLSLVKAIVSTHLTLGRIDDEQNLYAAETNYRRLEMGESESIANFFRRFTASLASFRECASRAGKEETMPDDEQQSIHFVMQLSVNYGAFKDNFRRGMISPKPTTLQEAYERICNFGPGRSTFAEPRHRGVFVTRGGRGGGRGGPGRGFGGGRGGFGGGRGACAICHQYGHWKNECPQAKSGGDEDVSKAVEQVKEEKKVHFPAGNGGKKQKN